MLKAYTPGTYSHQNCPQCHGGKSNDQELSVTITPDGKTGLWNCFRGNCENSGQVSVDSAQQRPMRPAGMPITVHRLYMRVLPANIFPCLGPPPVLLSLADAAWCALCPHHHIIDGLPAIHSAALFRCIGQAELLFRSTYQAIL